MDVARTWGCHWLEHVLSPKSLLPIPRFPPSAYLSSPLASVITLARYVRTHRRFNKNHHEHFLNMDGWMDNTCRDCGLALNMSSLPTDTMADDGDACAVCLERPCNVAAEGLSVGEILLN